jgi:hypothetical protein
MSVNFDSSSSILLWKEGAGVVKEQLGTKDPVKSMENTGHIRYKQYI